MRASEPGGPHAPDLICGIAPAYDKNGNTLVYDGDGTTANVQPRIFVYDLENRPISITGPSYVGTSLTSDVVLPGVPNQTVTFEYGQDGERVSKKLGTNAPAYFIGNGECATERSSGTSCEVTHDKSAERD